MAEFKHLREEDLEGSLPHVEVKLHVWSLSVPRNIDCISSGPGCHKLIELFPKLSNTTQELICSVFEHSCLKDTKRVRRCNVWETIVESYKNGRSNG